MATGDIGAVIDSLEFDADNCDAPHIIHISGDVFAVVYVGTDDDGWVKTFTVDAAGNIGAATIDSLEFDGTDCSEPRIIPVAGDVYAIVYEHTLAGKVITITIDSSGNIGNSVIDTLTLADAVGEYLKIVHVSGDIFAIVYNGGPNDGLTNDGGWLITITITSGGTITGEIDTLNWAVDTSGGSTKGADPHDIIHISGTTFAFTAQELDTNDGMLYTVAIESDGQIGAAVIDSLEFDPSNGWEIRILPVAGTTYVLAYTQGAQGYLKTVTIDADGTIGSVIATLEYDAGRGYYSSIVNIGGAVFVIAYGGPDGDGFIKTVTIQSDGTISTVIDTLEFDAVTGTWPSLVIVPDSDGYVAVAYYGVNGDGWVKSAQVTIAGTGPAVYKEYYALVDWDGDGDFSDTYEDIVDDILDIDIDRGKDRELGHAIAAFMTLEVKNGDHKYSVPNRSSVLNSGGNSLRAGHKIIVGMSYPFDEFTGDDGASINARAPTVQYGTEVWSEESGTFVIDTNRMKETGGSGGEAVMETEEADAHICVRFKKGADNDGIIVFRFSDTSNYFYVRTTNTDIEVRKVQAGADTQLATTARSWAVAAIRTLKVILHGDYIYVLVDRVLYINTTSTFNETATKHGIGGANIHADARYDNWGCVYQLFHGTIDNITMNTDPSIRTAYIECSDDFKILAKPTVRGYMKPYGGWADGTDEFYEEILKRWTPNASQLGFILDAGENIVESTKPWWDRKALDICYSVEAQENGFFYQDPDGLWRGENRTHRTTTPHDASIKTWYAVRATNGMFFTGLKWRSGMEDVINRVTVEAQLSVAVIGVAIPQWPPISEVSEVWRCREADVVDEGVSSSTLSIAGGATKIIFFEVRGLDAISDIKTLSSSATEYKIEGTMTNGPFKIGEQVNGSVSGERGWVVSQGGGYIVLGAPTGVFDAGDTFTGQTSGAALNGGCTITGLSDYKANAQADGAGADKTGQLAVAVVAQDTSDATNWGKGGKLTLVNSDGGTIYVTKLRILGTGYEFREKISALVVDATSEATYGEGSHDVNSDMFSTYDECKALADDIETKEDDPRAKVEILMQNSTKETLMQILARRLSDRITLNWSDFGVNEDFYINRIRHHIYNGGASIDCLISLEEVA